MKFLKTLQKKQSEQPLDIDALDNVVPQNKIKEQRINKPPEFLNTRNSKIGKPNSTRFNNRSDSIADKLDSVVEVFPTDVALVSNSDSLIDSIPSRAKTATADEVPLNSFVETVTVDKTALNSFAETKIPVKPSLDPFVLTAIDPEHVNPRIVAITQPNSSYCEEYRSLRTQILHKSQKQKLQSIVVASVGPSEGKSVTALNLSWLLAQTDGISALIIDSDLRKPSLTNYLGIETKIGLSEVLEGKCSLREAVIRLEPAGLHLLPGGESRYDVAELISGQRFKEILDEIRGMFDYVIIDAPPLGIFTDAAVLINHADGALLIVRANQTPYKGLERVLEMLPRERMIGAVLNQSEDTLTNDSYYYNNYYQQENR